jgi:hypothetical protein
VVGLSRRYDEAGAKRRGLSAAEAGEVLELSEQAVRDLELAEVAGTPRPVEFERRAVRRKYEERVDEAEYRLGRMRDAARRYGIVAEDGEGEQTEDGTSLARAASATQHDQAAERLRDGEGSAELLERLWRELQAKYDQAMADFAERSGWAVNQVTIDGLKENLRIANDTIAGLSATVLAARANPDVNIDRPRDAPSGG